MRRGLGRGLERLAERVTRWAGGTGGFAADLEILRRRYHELAQLARKERETGQSHSVEEARSRHARKESPRKANSGVAG